MPDFTHLHVHTQYSILDGAASIPSLLSKAKETGMTSLAISDHGNMYGVLKFVSDAKKAGIKPIIGCEMYVAENSRFEKKGKVDRSGYHLVLLAQNKVGYKNLSRLSSLGFTEGFYYTPRIDKEILRQYNEGLIALSACLGGEIPETITTRGVEKAEEVLKEYLDIFGDRFYLELQRSGQPEQKNVNEVLIAMAAKFNVPLVATNDVHFVNASDFEAHRILICLNTGKDLEDVTGMHYTGQEYMKSPGEMLQLFIDVPEAIKNTRVIADRIEDFDLSQDILLPKFPLPEGFTDEDEFLHHLTYKGAEKLYPDMNDELRERLDFELSVVKKMGFAGYFLIVQDFINAAREMGVAVGPGRGSAAGSAVAYCIRITNVDPIKYSLLFERFLNPDRISMPDIDVDFDDDGRDKVIDYVVKKYGTDHVAQIITFGTMAARSAIRDVARVLRLPLPEADRLAKLIPEEVGITLKGAFDKVPELSQARKSENDLIRKTLAFAEILEGSNRHTGTHACGIIIGPDDLKDYIPLSVQKDSIMPVTQFEGKLVEQVGMLKMDFLGLRNLSIIKDAIDNIEMRHGIRINIDDIPLDDPKTFELFKKGDTIGVFQFESDGMRKHLADLKPTNIEDLIAMNALFRPGPMSNIPTFINRKHGKEKVAYPHPLLETILKNTYGIMVFQEQIMQISRKMAGFSGGKADELRKAMGKKKIDIIAKLKDEFVEGAVSNQVDRKVASDVYDTMAKFGEYGFNRSHSAAYSIVAYQTAYLKANYSAEYMAALLSRHMDSLDDVTFYMDESKRMDIPVLGPDINESGIRFTVNEKGAIRFSLSAIKGVGEAAVQSLLDEKEKNGPYTDIFDFVKRVSLRTVNRKSIENLAQAGAFDNFGIPRSGYFLVDNMARSSFIEKIISFGNAYQQQKESFQQSLFGETADQEMEMPETPKCAPWELTEMLQKEKDVIGIYLSGHPLDPFRLEVETFAKVSIRQLKEDWEKFRNKEFVIAGIVSNAQHKTAKTGNLYGTFILEDYTDSIEFMMFSDDFLKFKSYLTKDYPLLVKGKVIPRYKDADKLEGKILSMEMLSDLFDKHISTVTISFDLKTLDETIVSSILKTIHNHPGKCNVHIVLSDADDHINLGMRSRSLKVKVSRELLKDMKNIPGVNIKLG
ncbi:MAG: DNA polymerase III subunit alpha [Bacteroidota bacterium]